MSNFNPHAITDSAEPTSIRKRKRSEDPANDPSPPLTVSDPASDSPSISPIILPAFILNADEPYVAPPSPVPTEIVEDAPEPTSEEYLAATKQSGVKVRDFAYEPRPQGRDIRAPETWSKPLDTLALHDYYIRLNPSSEQYGPGLSGKLLFGLLSTGLVTQQEAEHNWRVESEWAAYNAYVHRPQGPYPIALPNGFKKPTAAFRRNLLEDSFPSLVWDMDGIHIPPDIEGMVDGPKNLPESQRALRRLVRPAPHPHYAAASHPVAAPQPQSSRAETQSQPAGSRPRPVSSTEPQVATPSVATGHNALAESAHVDKRRRTSDPPANPSLGPSLSRSTSSCSLSGSSPRAGTPPPDEAPHRPRPGNLARTTTLNSIPVQ